MPRSRARSASSSREPLTPWSRPTPRCASAPPRSSRVADAAGMDKFFRKYVWDDERTPYLVRVARLTRGQIEYELRFYAVITGVLFALVSVAALSNSLPHGDARGGSRD